MHNNLRQLRQLRQQASFLAGRAFLRWRWLRRLAGLFPGRTAPQLSHLRFFKEEAACGPIQRDEALLLFALVRVLRPRVVVELGFHRGHSALNFLLALPPDAELHSYDITESAAQIASQLFGGTPKLHYHHKSQESFTPADVGGKEIDLVLFDAAHDLALNVATFEKMRACLAPRAVVAVHDTGTWRRACMGPEHLAWAAERPAGWLSAEDYAPWDEERRFVNWLRDTHPELAQLHLHSDRTLRHGLTLLQASGRLATVAGTA
ncbi:MAG: class I SAM-dependent methyltransferase [Thermoanaerobaculia bacterium]